MKVIDLDNIKIPSINNKYGVNRGRLFLTSDYRNFKKLIADSCIRASMSPPYWVRIEIDTYTDIDNAVKVILDGLQVAGVITDDKYVNMLTVIKNPIKRGHLGKIKVEVLGNEIIEMLPMREEDGDERGDA